MDLKHKATRAAIGAGFETAMNMSKNNPENAIVMINKIFSKYYSPVYGNEITEAFETLSNFLARTQNKWENFASHIFSDVDHRILKAMMLNLAYEGGYLGWNKSRKIAEENNCNVPFCILMDPGAYNPNTRVERFESDYKRPSYLTYEDIDSIMTQGKDLGIHFYLFSGSEPLLRKTDLFKLAKKHFDCMIHIFTNGKYIDQRFCDDVKECGNIILSLNIGGTMVGSQYVSESGFTPSMLGTMELMKRNKLAFGATLCWTEKNYKELISEEFIDTLIDKGCLWSWYYHYIPSSKNADVSFLPSPEHRAFMFKKIREMRDDENGKLLFPIDFHRDSEYFGGCMAGGKNYLHINSCGDVEPCVFIHFSSSNIHSDTLLESLKQPLFKAFKQSSDTNVKDNVNPYLACPIFKEDGDLAVAMKNTGSRLMQKSLFEKDAQLFDKYSKEWKPYAENLWNEQQELKQHHKEKKS